MFRTRRVLVSMHNVYRVHIRVVLMVCVMSRGWCRMEGLLLVLPLGMDMLKL